MNSEFEKFISENRKAFDNREPDPAILNRIHEQLRGAKKKQGVLVPLRTLRWAAACLVLVACAAAFWMIQKDPSTKTNPTATVAEPIVKPATSAAAQLPAGNNEKSTTQNPQQLAQNEPTNPKPQTSNPKPQTPTPKLTLFASLSDMNSPSNRLAAAADAVNLKSPDKDIVDILVKTMNTDPNTNVRLAALESLSRFHREAYVRKQLVSALEKQKDPVVQIELIQLLTRMRETSILKQLDKITQDDNALKAVKDNAYSGIFTLRS